MLHSVELESHDGALRIGSSDAAESEILEHLFPAEERIRGPSIGSCDGPTLNGEGTFAPRHLDRRPHQRVSDSLGSNVGPDVEARQQPDQLVLVAVSIL